MEKRYPRTMMATACVPWDERFNFEENLFRKQVNMLTAGGIRSIYLFGTAGEGYAVNREQYKAIVTAFLDEMKGVEGALPMVGIISLSMSEIMERVALGMELGARDFQISFPSWGAVTPDEGMNFVREVCRNFPQARFMHYNNGGRSKTRLAFEHYKRLCEDVGNLVAVKNPGLGIMDVHNYYAEELPLEFYILEPAYGYASLMTDCSLLISMCNLDLRRAWEYFDAGKNRDVDAIMRLHQEFSLIHKALFKAVPAGGIDSIYDKLFVKACMPEFPQRLYPPYVGASDEQFQGFIAELRANVPRWNIIA